LVDAFGTGIWISGTSNWFRDYVWEIARCSLVQLPR
jgi:hypothetical protein